MTIAELSKHLQQYDPALPVYCHAQAGFLR